MSKKFDVAKPPFQDHVPRIFPAFSQGFSRFSQGFPRLFPPFPLDVGGSRLAWNFLEPTPWPSSLQMLRNDQDGLGAFLKMVR
jgi:hypothetical protein